MIKINLRRESSARKGFWGPKAIPVEFLAVSLALIVSGLLGVWYWHLVSERSAAQTQVESLRVEHLQLKTVRDELQKFEVHKRELDQRIGVIEKLKENQKGPVRMMNGLIASVPAQPRLWLTSLQQKDKVVTLEGRALDVPAIADFISALNERPPFKRVELDYWEEQEHDINFKLSLEIEN